MREENAILKCNENLREVYYCRFFLKDNIFKNQVPIQEEQKKKAKLKQNNEG